MKEFERQMITIFNEYAEDHGPQGVLEELFPGMTIGELVYNMYESGMIPEDTMEKFLEGDA